MTGALFLTLYFLWALCLLAPTEKKSVHVAFLLCCGYNQVSRDATLRGRVRFPSIQVHPISVMGYPSGFT